MATIKSIEEKARAYDIALDKIKRLLGSGSNCSREELEYVFPELEKSDDEKIRKELIGFLRNIPNYNYTCEEMALWLEEQGKNNMGISEATKKKLEDNLNKALEEETPESWNKFLDEQGEQKEYTFKSLPRLLDMIEPTDRAKAYCQKLIDTLIKEGYATDAKIVGECLKKMNGENVSLAIMDEKQGEQKTADRVEPKFRVGDVIRPKGSTTEYTIESISGGCYRGNLWRLPIGCDDDYELVDQKTADKVEPKFHEGEWIVHHGTENIYQVVAIIDNQYQLKYGDNYTTQYCEDVDRCTRLYDVTKDAKSGDVLSYREGQWIFIYKQGEGTCFEYYALVSENGLTIKSVALTALVSCIVPATKEQRDLLFQKMKEADYEWDAEHKQLRKIEQNPIDKYKEWYDFIRWFVKQRTDDYTLIPSRDDIHKWGDVILNHAIKVLEQWSEEDERMWSQVINEIEAIKSNSSTVFEKNIAQDKIDWLKNLKDRVQPQPQQEWSEEDDYNYGIIQYILNNECVGRADKEIAINWFKSLKERYTWKPSDEQMKCLEYTITLPPDGYGWVSTIESLYNDLKKL